MRRTGGAFESVPAPLGSGTTTPRARWSRGERGLIAAILALLLIVASPGMAQAVVQENIKVPLAGGVIAADVNPCSDEDLVHTAGYLHIAVSYTENHNRISGTAHFQPMGAKLVGVDTGSEYVGTGMFQETFSEPLDGSGATTTTFVSNFRVIGKGSTPSLLIHEMGHITFNPDGTVTADVFSSSVTCR